MIEATPPTGRIVLFGATGYTGDLAARALVGAGSRPVLAGRDAARLAALARELGEQDGALEHAVADVSEPSSVAALVGPGDVLLTTVGPFTRWGRAALDAAVGVGAHYVDSTGEGAFIRTVFESAGPRAERSGSALLTAFGYDFVPGNLAGALALRQAADAGGEPVAVDVGYFLTGIGGAGAASRGTRASATAILGRAGHALRDGRIAEERPGTQVVRLRAGGRVRSGLTVAGSEQFTLPRLSASLRTVRVGLGWLGGATEAASLAARALGQLDRLPPMLREPVGHLAGTARRLAAPLAGRLGAPLAGRLAPDSSGGPDEAARDRTGSLVAAEAYDAAGRTLAHVELTGPNPYTVTGGLLAWAARSLASRAAPASGALGPVDAFGLDTLRDACAALGLSAVDAGGDQGRAS